MKSIIFIVILICFVSLSSFGNSPKDIIKEDNNEYSELPATQILASWGGFIGLFCHCLVMGPVAPEYDHYRLFGIVFIPLTFATGGMIIGFVIDLSTKAVVYVFAP